MNRLTKDLHNQYNDYWYREDLEQVSDKEQIVLTKLGMLEDIEEELGIDLITYFKIKVGIQVYSTLTIDDDLIIDNIFGSGKNTVYHIVKRYSKSGVFVGLDEYGRNWALTEEELL